MSIVAIRESKNLTSPQTLTNIDRAYFLKIVKHYASFLQYANTNKRAGLEVLVEAIKNYDAIFV